MTGGIWFSIKLYELFFDELHQHGLPLRGIWLVDIVHYGASYVLSEGMIGDEPHRLDNCRGLLPMINHFQELMPPSLIAIGFSWGFVSIAFPAVFSSRLFLRIIFMELTFATTPAIRKIDRTDKGIVRSHRAIAMIKRKDIWPSIDDARSRLGNSLRYGGLDSRVFERVIRYDLGPAPPEGCAEIGFPDAVTLTTLKSLEIGSTMLPDPPLAGSP